jgi:hypothetical protein
MAILLLVLLGVVAVAWVALWLSPVHRVTFRDVLDADPDGPVTGEVWPPVTVIAPARNEADVLPSTVPTYCSQGYPSALEVVVVDDQSDDGTSAALAALATRFPNLRPFRTEQRPPGWIGKTWAVASGVRYARETEKPQAGGLPRREDLDASIYVFTDTDCAFHPRAVLTAVRLMVAHDVEMLSVLPRMEFGPACEKVVLPVFLTTLGIMFPFGVVNNPTRPLAIAAGGFIAIRRAAYEKMGGHEAVRGQIVEDMNLARLAKSLGVRTHMRTTRDLVTTHMYADWPDMWEGLTKNAYAGMDCDPKKLWVGEVVGFLVGVLPPVYLTWTVAWALSSHASVAWAAVALAAVGVAGQAAVHARAVRHMGLPLYHVLLMPVGFAVYLAIIAASAFQHHYRGGNVWKGRRIAVVAATGMTKRGRSEGGWIEPQRGDR